MKRRPDVRALLARLVVWQLVWMICFHNALVAVTGAAVARTDDGRIVVLCTVQGLQSMQVGGSPDDGPLPDAPGPLCPTALLGGALSMAMPATAPALRPPAPRPVLRVSPGADRAPSTARRTTTPIRAPPRSV